MSHTNHKGCDVLLIGFEGQENLGLRSVAAYLIREGIAVEIEPLQGVSQERILARIRERDPKIVGLSLIFQRMFDDYVDLISYLRKHGVKAHLTIGGHFPTFEFERILSSVPGLDSVIRHEGEDTLLELFQKLDQPESWPEIKGLAFRKDGKIHATPPRHLVPNLDTLPFPLRDPCGATHRGIGIRSIAGSRGCYYDCTFCSIHEFYKRSPGHRRRTRSPENLVQEMEELFHDYGVRIFILQDDDLFMRGRRHREWLEGLLTELKARKMDDQILWRVSCRVDDVDAKFLTRMKAAGLAGVYLGIESGSEQGLKTFNKRYRVSDVFRTLEVLRNVALPFEFGFMIFEPYSTMDSVRENIEFLKRIGNYGDSLVHFCKMSPYAGTAIARRLEAEGRLEGSVSCPDYRFLDPRLDLLQLFYSQTFNFRNFDDRGLVERLRFAKFDACVVAKFFAEEHDAKAYREAVSELIRQSNESALETMSLGANFMEAHDASEVIAHWQVLEELRQQEQLVENQITATLDPLMIAYGFEASLASQEARVTVWPPEPEAIKRHFDVAVGAD